MQVDVMRARSISLYDETFKRLVEEKNKRDMTHDEFLNCVMDIVEGVGVVENRRNGKMD